MWLKIIGVILAIAVFIFVMRYLWFLLPVGMVIYYFAKGKKRYSKGKIIGASALCVVSLFIFAGTSNSPAAASVSSSDNLTVTDVRPTSESAPEIASTEPIPEPPDPILQLREQAESLTLESAREEYEAVQAAFDALSYSERKDLEEISDKLKEVSSAIEQREKEQEDKEIVAEFESIILSLPDNASDAQEGFSEAAIMYFKMTPTQKELLSEEIREKYDNLNTQIEEIKHREHLENTTVVISATGSKYHYKSCRTLKYDGTETTAAAAKASGYGPCGVCNPPN